MFARILTMNLKTGGGPNFARVIGEEVNSMLRKFPGYKVQISLVSADGAQALGISFWQEREDAEAYNRSSYPDVPKALAKCIEGTPP